MAERQLDELTNLSHLLTTATNIVVTDLVQVGLLILALNRIALCNDVNVNSMDVSDILTCMDDGILRNYTEFGGVGLNDLELNSSHAPSDKESITLAHRTVGWNKDQNAGGYVNKMCNVPSRKYGLR